MLNIKIRKTRFWEYRRIARLYSEVFSKEYKENWDLRSSFRKIKILSKYCDLYSVFYKNELIGFLMLNPYIFVPGTVIWLEEFGIKDKFRNKGIGSYCLGWIEKEYLKKGFTKVMFLSLKDSKAFDFYKRKKYNLSKNQYIFEKELK